MIKKYCIIIFLLLGVIFLVFPKLDISFAQIFYHEHLDFIYRDHPVVVAIFKLVPIITTLCGVVMALILCYNSYYHKKVLASRATYLLLAVLIGPGLVVNYALKDHFGRARPRQVLEFGGDKAFTPPLYISNECDTNCSFSCGHASMGYYFSSFSYLVPIQYKGIVFLFGIALGSAIGLGRVLQGGHFLSDVIFSGLFIILTNHLCFILWQKLTKKTKTATRRKRKK